MRYHVYQCLDKTDNFDFLGPHLPKNGFWGQNCKNLSLNSESASLRYYVQQFSDKIFGLKFAQKWILGSEFFNIPCVLIFSQKWPFFNFLAKILGNCPTTCNILVQTLLRVLKRATWRLKSAGWRLKWAGWR